MKKMIYFCPVDWRWIKQRPQFMAEELSTYYQVHAVYPYSKNRKGLQKKSPTHVSLTPYITLPAFGGRFKLLNRVNRFLVRVQVGTKIRLVNPEIIWVTLPAQLDMIPQAYRDRLVYDCMDDYFAMNGRQEARAQILEEEGALIHQAKLVFATSENLFRKLCSRYHANEKKMAILRNGYNAKWSPAQEKKQRGGRLKIGYFGTISHWFDFELLKMSLEARNDIEYHLYGPVAGGVQIPQEERIICHGVVEHDEIACCAKELDALIMPFQLDEIVLSVDPVKLYEYICLNKNILCIRYPEVERFAPFTFFYSTLQEYMRCIDRLQDDASLIYTKEQAERFLAENSWSRRAQCAHQTMERAGFTEEKR